MVDSSHDTIRSARGSVKALHWDVRGIVAATIALMTAAVMMLSMVLPAAYADDQSSNTGRNRYNVVFVSDTSGSMNDTDPKNLRYDAIGRFVALLADSGNRVGGVIFNDGIAYKKDLAPVDGVQAKQQFLDDIRKVPAKGWTNIGAGLQTADDMLDKNKDPNIPSVIVLLTDGNTAMGSDDETQQSLQTKAQALETARRNGYGIYSISLNADGSANSNELSQLSNATGGQFKEVKNASDLTDVFDMYYKMVFATKSDKGVDLTIPDSGKAEGTFDVASVGVEEVNIMVTGKPTDYSLTDPNGKQYTKDALSADTFSTDAFVSMKVKKPAQGTWKYTIAGTPGDHVRIDIVRNTDLSTELKAEGTKKEYAAGDAVTLNASVLEGGQAASGDRLSKFKAVATVTDGKGKSQDVELKAADKGFAGKVTFDKKGSYKVKARVSGEGYDVTSNELTFDVGNSAPKPNGDIEKTVKLWPFFKNTVDIDLTPGATDAQDKTLTYTIDSTAFNKDEYKLNGSKLTLTFGTVSSLSQGSFTIRATDSDGASCTFNVLVKTINIGLITAIAIIAGIVIAIIVVLLLLWIALNKRFYGTCYASEFDEENYSAQFAEVSRERNRGRIKLFAFGINTHGLDPRSSYLQASGKDYVTLVLKKPAYAQGRMTKKVKIMGDGYAVDIRQSPDAKQGINIRFVSRKANHF